jgi:paraquat-inducible protein B
VSRRASPTLIGAFVLGGMAIAVAAVLILASGSLFEKSQRFIMYFDEAVTGLSVGAPVIFQGVEIGHVVNVTVVVDNTRNAIDIPVIVEVNTDQIQVRGERLGAVRTVEQQMERGLRARLATLSILTGQLYVSLDYYPDKPLVLKKIDTSLPEVATVPSELRELRNTVSSLVDKIRGLPLEDLVTRLASAAKGVDGLVNKPELAHAVEQLDQTLTQANGTVKRLDARIDPLANEAQAALAAAREALTHVQTAVSNGDQMLQPGSPVQVQLLNALQELERAARSVRTLADGLAEKPDAIVFGKGSDSH